MAINMQPCNCKASSQRQMKIKGAKTAPSRAVQRTSSRSNSQQFGSFRPKVCSTIHLGKQPPLRMSQVNGVQLEFSLPELIYKRINNFFYTWICRERALPQSRYYRSCSPLARSRYNFALTWLWQWHLPYSSMASMAASPRHSHLSQPHTVMQPHQYSRACLAHTCVLAGGLAQQGA